MPLIFPQDVKITIISVIGPDTLLANIVAEIKQGKLYSILVDEVAATSSSNHLLAFNLLEVKATFVKNS